MTSPVRPIRTIYMNNDPNGYVNRVLTGTPSRGTVRVEWHNAVRGMVVPPNWSAVSITMPMNLVLPIRFQVADAQNLIVRECLKRDFEWLFLLEDDVIPCPDLLIRLNQYMREGKYPVLSGLYYTKSEPSEPLIYRGRGNGSFLDFKLGDLVFSDGVPTGCLLIHHSLLQVMWDDAESYEIGGETTRRVFRTPADAWIDVDSGQVNTTTGTSDLDWCLRVMKGNYFAKAGWPEFQDMQFPFLVDTSIQCLHITIDGATFPAPLYVPEFKHPPDLGPVKEAEKPPDLGVSVSESVAADESLS